MAFSLHMIGLGVGALSADSLDAYLLNSGAASWNIPNHLPTLVAPRAGLDLSMSPPPLPSLNGRVDSKWSDDSAYVGWDLTGVRLAVFDQPTSKCPQKYSVQTTRNPDPSNVNWHDLRWVHNWNEYFNGGKVDLSALRVIGPRTSCTISAKGGLVFAGAPHNGDDSEHLWTTNSPNNSVTRAFSDTLDVAWAGMPTVIFSNVRGQVTGTLKGNISEAFVINEPTPNDIANDSVANKGRGPSRDFLAYFEIAGWTRPMLLPSRGDNWMYPMQPTGVVDGAYCVFTCADV